MHLKRKMEVRHINSHHVTVPEIAMALSAKQNATKVAFSVGAEFERFVCVSRERRMAYHNTARTMLSNTVRRGK